MIPEHATTERTRRVLYLAAEEAARSHDDHVATEHIAIALVREGGGVAVAVLRELRVDLSALIRDLEASLPAGGGVHPEPLARPYTSSARHALELATADARARGHSFLGTEHLLMGLVRDEGGSAARVLAMHGASAAATAAVLARLLGSDATA